MFFPILTFPGVMLHESAHAIFCKLFRLKIFRISFFRFGTLSGFVEHEEPRSISSAFGVSIGPLVINSIVAMFIAYWSTYYGVNSPWFYLLIWLAFSFGSQALPSDQDANNIVQKNINLIRHKNVLYLITLPFYYLVWLSVWCSNKLKIVGFDMIYALLLIFAGLALK